MNAKTSILIGSCKSSIVIAPHARVNTQPMCQPYTHVIRALPASVEEQVFFDGSVAAKAIVEIDHCARAYFIRKKERKKQRKKKRKKERKKERKIILFCCSFIQNLAHIFRPLKKILPVMLDWAVMAWNQGLLCFCRSSVCEKHKMLQE